MYPLPTTKRVTLVVTAPSKLSPLFSAARDVSSPRSPCGAAPVLLARPQPQPCGRASCGMAAREWWDPQPPPRTPPAGRPPPTREGERSHRRSRSGARSRRTGRPRSPRPAGASPPSWWGCGGAQWGRCPRCWLCPLPERRRRRRLRRRRLRGLLPPPPRRGLFMGLARHGHSPPSAPLPLRGPRRCLPPWAGVAGVLPPAAGAPSSRQSSLPPGSCLSVRGEGYSFGAPGQREKLLWAPHRGRVLMRCRGSPCSAAGLLPG